MKKFDNLKVKKWENNIIMIRHRKYKWDKR